MVNLQPYEKNDKKITNIFIVQVLNLVTIQSCLINIHYINLSYKS